MKLPLKMWPDSFQADKGKMSPLGWSLGPLSGTQGDVRCQRKRWIPNGISAQFCSMGTAASCSLWGQSSGEGPSCSRGPGDMLRKKDLMCLPPCTPQSTLQRFQVRKSYSVGRGNTTCSQADNHQWAIDTKFISFLCGFPRAPVTT